MRNAYNGWENYATWRVKLEFFDDGAPFEPGDDVDDLADRLREYVEEHIAESCTCTYVAGFAHAFIEDVGWDQIAEALIEEYEEE